MHRGLVPSISLALALSACGNPSTAPDTVPCDVQNGAEVCVQRAQYRPGQTVTFTTRNTTNAPIFKDACSTKLVGVTNLDVPFEAIYAPTLRCGPSPTQADIVAAMVEIAPGETFEESLPTATFTFQGFYRVNVWILNSDGTLAANAPAFSGVFEIFPSAD